MSLRLLPFLFILYICAYLDRTNVAIAALEMNRDLGFSAAAYGLGASLFFVSYAIFEVPSNILLARVGARRWIARIMVSWGLVAAAMMFVRTPRGFYILRFLLGAAEAGFFPGVVYYLGQWFPAAWRARAIARFAMAIPMANAIGAPLGGQLLRLNGWHGLAGWQWLYLVEGIPSIVLGVLVLAWLHDRPHDAPFLAAEQRTWLVRQLAREEDAADERHVASSLRALASPALWLVSAPFLLANTSAYAFTFWAPTLIRDALHTSAAATGAITGVIGLLAAIGGLLAGASSDARGERVGHAAAGTALITLGCAGAALMSGSPLARIAALALVPIGMQCFFPAYWCLPGMLLRGSAAAAGIALVNSIGNLGGFFGPNVVGMLQDATGGSTAAFLVLAVLPALATGMLLILRGRRAFAARAAA